MKETEGNVTRAALLLGVSKRQLHRWLKLPGLTDITHAKAGRPVGSHCTKRVEPSELDKLQSVAAKIRALRISI